MSVDIVSRDRASGARFGVG